MANSWALWCLYQAPSPLKFEVDPRGFSSPLSLPAQRHDGVQFGGLSCRHVTAGKARDE